MLECVPFLFRITHNFMMKRLFILLVCFFTSLASQADLFNNKPKFLPVDQAFQLQVQSVDNELSMHWQW